MTSKDLIIFISGLTVGGIAGVFGTKNYWRKHFEEIADTEIAEMDEYYSEKRKEDIEMFFPGDAEVNPQVEETDLKDTKEKLQKNYEQTTNYANMYKNTSKKSSEADEEIETNEHAAGLATAKHEENKKKKPKLISQDVLGDIPSYFEMKTLFYYTENEVITDEEDVIIDDPSYLLGDCLDKFDFRNSDEETIFIQNFSLDTIYEIQKVMSEFEV